MLRIVVLVSGGGTNLQALIDAQKKGIIQSGQITAVISSNREAYALVRARAANIPQIVLARKEYQDNEAYCCALLKELKHIQPDLIVLAGFMCILSCDIINRYKDRIINVHPSLIPAFCGEGHYGIHVHEKALEYGVKISGATVHFVDEIPDNGAVILQRAVDVLQRDTPGTLQKRVMEKAEWEILPKAVELFCAGKIEVCGRKTIIKE